MPNLQHLTSHIPTSHRPTLPHSPMDNSLLPEEGDLQGRRVRKCSCCQKLFGVALVCTVVASLILMITGSTTSGISATIQYEIGISLMAGSLLLISGWLVWVKYCSPNNPCCDERDLRGSIPQF